MFVSTDINPDEAKVFRDQITNTEVRNVLLEFKSFRSENS